MGSFPDSTWGLGIGSQVISGDTSHRKLLAVALFLHFHTIDGLRLQGTREKGHAGPACWHPLRLDQGVSVPPLMMTLTCFYAVQVGRQSALLHPTQFTFQPSCVLAAMTSAFSAMFRSERKSATSPRVICKSPTLPARLVSSGEIPQTKLTLVSK
jgi:hypothetical protein